MTGPAREHVNGDPQQDDPRIVMPFNGSSGSGDVTGEAVYANYCRLEDFDSLAAQHIDLKGKIAICRYGTNFRGVKVYLAEQRGAIGVLIYSDPQDDGYYKGDPYPSVHGVPIPASSAARFNISSATRAILKPPASPPRSICPTPPASRTSKGPTAISRASSPFPSALTMPRRFCRRSKGRARRKAGRVRCPFAITSVPPE
jgi:hypothetical protein